MLNLIGVTWVMFHIPSEALTCSIACTIRGVEGMPLDLLALTSPSGILSMWEMISSLQAFEN